MTEDNLLNPPERDAINPTHYKSHPSGIECSDIFQHLSPCLATALKYAWRCGKKDDPIQELDKALWYLNKELLIECPAQVICADKIVTLLKKVIEHEPDKNRRNAMTYIVLANSGIDYDTYGFPSMAGATRYQLLNGAIGAIESMKAKYAKT
jgi:hypothetical protein